MILMPKSPNQSCRFWGPNRKTLHHLDFEAQPRNPITGFEVKPGETVATSFEAKLAKTVRVVLKPNHPQTINLGFEAQPKNSRS
jgi:hypothetical protein